MKPFHMRTDHLSDRAPNKIVAKEPPAVKKLIEHWEQRDHDQH
jgi:hypothetical protein